MTGKIRQRVQPRKELIGVSFTGADDLLGISQLSLNCRISNIDKNGHGVEVRCIRFLPVNLFTSWHVGMTADMTKANVTRIKSLCCVAQVNSQSTIGCNALSHSAYRRPGSA